MLRLTLARARLFYLCAVAVFLVLGVPLTADTLTVGDNGGPGAANINPFGSSGAPAPGNYSALATFQEIYSAAEFPGAITITALSFAPASGVGGTDGSFVDTLSLALGTSAQPVASPSATYSDNRSSDFTTVFDGTVTENLAETDSFDLIFNLSTPFTYNPANGDLLFEVTIITPVVYSGSYLYFDADFNSSVSEVFNTTQSSTGNVFNGYGLFTQFTYMPASTMLAAPEPAPKMLTALGATLVAFVLFRAGPLGRRKA